MSYVHYMSESLDLQTINTRMAVLEERMNSMKAQNESAVDRMNALLADLRTDNAKRDKDNQRWIIGLVLGCTAIVVGAIAFL